MKSVEWTEDFEKRLIERLEDDCAQADNMVFWASHCEKPLKKGGIIDVKGSARTMVKWIKKNLGLCQEELDTKDN